MEFTTYLIFIVVGAAAGALFATTIKDGRFGMAGNVVVGIIGGFLGGFIFRVVALAVSGIIGSIITAAAGAIVLLFLVARIKKSDDQAPVKKDTAP
ncbi:MAG: GlsB/YeaQ/YmgE family stress response membrane protein [bacterium]|jgi:uncharacterized membrane protein YeaQ/YmgE (transglycosylase-associated protein family)|nr:GlsB/YeaQ/YmgE family stress response membrane protein [bacterium]